jgi:hypothetical protein
VILASPFVFVIAGLAQERRDMTLGALLGLVTFFLIAVAMAPVP